MKNDLIILREQAMDRAERALDMDWPERKSKEYVREMQSVANELEEIIARMQTEDIEKIEESRAHRYLGSVYTDLAPALGKEMLGHARDAYQKAETLLEDYDHPMEHAKLNFNFGNTLRQIDPNSIEQLQDAKCRFLAARDVFVGQAPQFLQQVDTALLSVNNLLRIAPVLNAVEKSYSEMKSLEEELKKERDLTETIQKIRRVMTRDGGAAGLTGKVKAIMAELPTEIVHSEKFAEIQEKMKAITELALGGSSLNAQEAHIIKLLRDRIETDLNMGKLSDDREETVRGIIGELESILSGNEDDVHAILAKAQKLRSLAESTFSAAHYLSHGIERPPDGSRAAELVELCWSLRRFLLEEMNRSGKGPEESKEVLELNKRNAKVDKRIYESGANNARAVVVDKEELRPLSLAVRNFSARIHPMLSKPIWPSVSFSVNTDAVFYSGSGHIRKQVEKICNSIGCMVMKVPKGESIANARWKQIKESMSAIFDLGMDDGPERASVAYELGIALTLGKPVVVVASAYQSLPFDIDVEPVVLEGDPIDEKRLASAIDRSLVWNYSRTRSKPYLTTVDFILSKYSRPHPDTYVDQMLKLLTEQRKEPDPIALNRLLREIVKSLGDVPPVLIYPVWAPAYPEADKMQLFHVMPFRPDWADSAVMATRQACKALSVEYVRGDEVEDPNVIRSIWEQIARSTHVLVDLTGFNANVAHELGITHTLGRPSCLVGQGDTVEKLFPMISKRRFYTYEKTTDLAEIVRDFLT